MTNSRIIKSISSPRLSSYKNIFHCHSDEACIPYYRWNQSLSSELYILLSTIEVCLRNSIHEALSEETSVKFTGNTNNNFCWYDYFFFFEVDKKGQRKYDRFGNPIFTETGKAFRKLTHNKQNVNLNRLPQVVISKLEFGKWSYILSAKKYENGDLIDWNKLFPIIFPNFKDMHPSKHQTIIERIKVVKGWRNRLAHLEPVWKFSDVKDPIDGRVLVIEPKNQKEVLQRLNNEMTRAIQLLFWLCLDTCDHYKMSGSYKNLSSLISNDGIEKFSI